MPPKKRKAEPSKDQEKPKKRKDKGKGKAVEEAIEPTEMEYDDDDFQETEILQAIRLSRQVHPSTGSAGASTSRQIPPPPPPVRPDTGPKNDDDDDFQDPIRVPTRQMPSTRRTATTATTSTTTSSTTSTRHPSVLTLSQELEERLSITPEPVIPSAATPMSKKIEMKKKRAEALKAAREEEHEKTPPKGKSRDSSKRDESRARKTERTKFVVKTGLKGIISDELNEDQKNTFVNRIRQVVRHISDVTYATSLFVNWFCLRQIANNEAIPRLNHNFLYHFAALFVGQGKYAPDDVKDAFRLFTQDMGESFNRERQFPNLQYTTILTIVMRSYETLIANHISSNFKSRTLQYLFVRISSANEPSYLALATGVKRSLCQKMYTCIISNTEMTYTDKPQIGDNERNAITNLINECRRRLVGLPKTEEHIYANPHLYLPWLFHVLQRMEENVSIREPVADTKARKGFVHRQLHTMVNFKRLPAKFRKTLECHVKEAINSATIMEPFVDRTFTKSTKRSSRALDPNQRKFDDLLHEEKVAIDNFVTETRGLIASKEFRPQKYTDPRGARLYNLLPIYSQEMRFITLNLTALGKLVRDSRVARAPGQKETMNQLCWRMFDMTRIGFQASSQLHGTSDHIGFTGVIRTDGVALEFVCDRQIRPRTDLLTPVDINNAIDLDAATIWGVDPGQRDVFVASDGDHQSRHRIRKTSTMEYYHMAGYQSAKVKRAKFDRQHRNSREIISQRPSTKTVNQEQFNVALRYIFQNFAITATYYTEAQRSIRFTNYRKRQKSLNEMCKRLFSNSSKYNSVKEEVQNNNPAKWKPLTPVDKENEQRSPIVVAFGSAKFGNLRGNVPAPTKLFKTALMNHLKKPRDNIQRNDLYGPKFLVMINEFYTSQICPVCKTRTTVNEKDQDDQEIHSVLNCQTCATRWNRDHMASINIRSIFIHMAKNENNRPEIFKEDENEET